MQTRRFSPAFLFCTAALGVQAAPHEHGSARMNVAVEAERIVIELESPLHDLVGFEHAPRDARQRAAVAALEPALRDAARHFRPNPEAGCSAAETRVAHPFGVSAAAPAAAAPRRGHADLRARLTFVCTTPGALRSLEVRLFDTFPRLKRIRVQSATPRGQGSATLTPKRRALPL